MDSQDNISLYANILKTDSNFEAQFLEKSKITPMTIQDSSPELKIVTPKTTTQGGNFSVEEDVLLVSAWLNTTWLPCVEMSKSKRHLLLKFGNTFACTIPMEQSVLLPP